MRDLDLELEVAAVIGRAGTNLTPAQARTHIAGYTIFNDWSARDLQLTEMQLGLGPCKGKDFANTLGPWIVTADELEPYRSEDRLDLALEAKVNGRPLGRDTLASMAWSFEELVSYASRGIRTPPAPARRRARLRYLRLRLPARALGPLRPRLPSASAGRGRSGTDRRGDR